MNSLESRIYADAAHAAEEITPDAIPPLRLPTSPGQTGRLAGLRWAGPRRRRAARWLLPLAAAASGVVICVVAVAVAGSRDAGPGGTSPATGSATSATSHPAHPGSAAQNALAAAALDYYFPASGAQYTEGLAFQWTQTKLSREIFGSCMARAGYPQPPFTTPERLYLRAFPDNSQFPDLAQMASTGGTSGTVYIAPRTVKPRSAPGKAALASCTTAANRPFAPIGKIAGPLQNRWLTIITRIQTSATVQATQPGFGACLQAHGIPASYAQQRDPGASNPLFAGYFAWMDHLGQAATSTRQRSSEDRRWTPVFVRCARSTVSLMERLQLAKRTRFLAQHARPVEELRTLVRALPGIQG